MSRRRTALMGAGGLMVTAGLVLAVTAFALPGPTSDTNASLTSSALSTYIPFVEPTADSSVPTQDGRKAHVPTTRPTPATTSPLPDATTSATQVPGPTPTVSSSPSSTDSPTTAPAKKSGIVLADVQLRNVGTGDCADLPGFGSAAGDDIVAQYTCAVGDQDNQTYKLAYSGHEFMMENVVSKKCLDLKGFGPVPAGSDVLINPCRMGDSDNLMFREQTVKGGDHIINVKSDLCLDISPDAVSYLRLDKKLTLSPCSSATTQTWQLKTAS